MHGTQVKRTKANLARELQLLQTANTLRLNTIKHIISIIKNRFWADKNENVKL
ncbi:MAG: hypothetical protein AVDCRST_MAG96-1673 [uncultured Segetibacter sp.]|uniref:Uncharacterized protein n=1 Tax=uncultured Segetibacter sp. TaxID=481133 RepID=A0A6J4SI08_9BACT|nr:MAG: hypothetical protein AVDCRST_MAG96-1673 [uncultured Segetibacter sp.]